MQKEPVLIFCKEIPPLSLNRELRKLIILMISDQMVSVVYCILTHNSSNPPTLYLHVWHVISQLLTLKQHDLLWPIKEWDGNEIGPVAVQALKALECFCLHAVFLSSL